MIITIDDAKIKQAAHIIRLNDNTFDYEDLPSSTLYEKAVALWLEHIIERLWDEPDFYAFKHAGHFNSDWVRAFETARHKVAA